MFQLELFVPLDLQLFFISDIMIVFNVLPEMYILCDVRHICKQDV